MYLILGLILAVSLLPGVFLVALGLVGDRLRGSHREPRCRRCWYSLVGIDGALPVVCPECGTAAASTRDLHRARILRWPVRAGILLILLALPAVWMLSRTWDSGLLRYMPTSVLLAACPAEPSEYDPILKVLRERHQSGRMPLWMQTRLVKRAVVKIGRLEGTGWESDWSHAWTDGLMPTMAWIVLHDDQTERERVIGAYLSSTDVKLQMVGIHLARWERRVHGLRSQVPKCWHDAIAAILARDQHSGDDVFVISNSGVMASPRIVELLVSRALNPEQPGLKRNLAFAALESIAKDGQPSLAPHLPRLFEAMNPASPVYNYFIYAMLIEMGTAAAPASPLLEELVIDPNFKHRVMAQRALRAVKGEKP